MKPATAMSWSKHAVMIFSLQPFFRARLALCRTHSHVESRVSPAAVNLSVSRRRVVLGGLAWSVAALVGGVPMPMGGAALAQSAPTEGDEYDIPGGHFFTEGAPNGQQTGLGFAVFDGNGASLWTAFQSAGGVAQLGYPTSRRFELNGDIGQAFSPS